MPPFTAEVIADADRKIAATCHPKQRDFVYDNHRRVSCLVGRGGGKSLGMLLRILRRMIHKPNSNCLFIAATRQSAERLVWRDLKRIAEKLAEPLKGIEPRAFNESDLTFTLANGSQLLLFGADSRDDINKLRGITYHEVGVDEVASIKLDILDELLTEVIGPRMVGAICLIGTPGRRLEGLFYEATRVGSDQHRPWADRDRPEYRGWNRWSSHSWSVQDGADAGIAAMEEFLAYAQLEKADKGWGDDNPRWLREYCGKWSSDNSSQVYVYRPHDEHGSEWNQWTPRMGDNGFAVLPTTFRDWGYGIGIDVGFKDAFALEVFAWSYSDPSRTIYHVHEIYQTRQYANTIAKMLIGEELNHRRYGGIVGAIGWPAVMVGDFAMAGGGLLAELQTVYGITVVAADKQYKMKENFIELMNGDLFDGRVKVMKGSKLAEEMGTLQWTVDQYGKRQENKAQANHATDAALYLRVAVAPLLSSATAMPSPEEPKRSPFQDDDTRIPIQEPEYDANAMYSTNEW